MKRVDVVFGYRTDENMGSSIMMIMIMSTIFALWSLAFFIYDNVTINLTWSN